MQKPKPTYSCLLTFGRLISEAQKTTVRYPKRTRRTPSGSTAMKLPRKRLSPRPLLPLIDLTPKTPKNVIEANKETVEPPIPMLSR